MSYKQGNPLVKLVIFALVVYGGYKFGLPWAKEKNLIPGSGATSARPARDAGCLELAESAAATWSGGISRFINPPIDPSAWSSFRSEVDGAISSARKGCNCSEQSCAKANLAMKELRSLLSDMDAAARSGGPPTTDIVRAQERIDSLLDEARTLTNQGK